MRPALILALATTASAVTLPVTISTTPQQAIFHYTRPDSTPCSLTASDLLTGVTVNELNTTLFPSFNLDTRDTNNIINGSDVQFVLGFRGVKLASDGRYYSRSLQVANTYSYTLTCGAASNYTATGTFTTANAPLGNSAPDPFQWAPSTWGNWGFPTMQWSGAYASGLPYWTDTDPQTGMRMVRWTDADNSPALVTANQLVTEVIPYGSGWTNVGNVGLTADSSYSEYSGSGGFANAAFFWGGVSQFRIQLSGNTGPGPYTNYDSPADLQLTVDAYADAASTVLSVCLTQDQKTCSGNTLTTTLPVGSGNKAQVSFPTSSTYPQALFQDWGNPLITVDAASTISYASTVASVSGSTVSIAGSGVPFEVTALKPGMTIDVSGTSGKGCTNSQCHIATVTNEYTIQLVETITGWSSTFTTLSASVSSGASTFTAADGTGFIAEGSSASNSGWNNISMGGDTVSCNTRVGNVFSGCSGINNAHSSGISLGQTRAIVPAVGFLVWKSSGSGNVFIDDAHTNPAFSQEFGPGYQGAAANHLSGTTVSTTYDRTGTSGSTTYNLALAAWPTISNNYVSVYWVDVATGEPRHVADFSCGNSEACFSVNDTNPLAFAYADSGGVTHSCTYDPTNSTGGHYKAIAQGAYTSFPVSNPAVTCSTLGTGALSMITTACPAIDTSYFPYLTPTSVALPLVTFSLGPGQNNPAWYIVVDYSQPSGSQVTRCISSFGQQTIPPSTALVPTTFYRWNEGHGDVFLQQGGADPWIAINAQVPLSPSNTPYFQIMSPAILNNGGSTALTSTFTDPSTCQALGVTDSRWIALGATGNNCIQLTTTDIFPHEVGASSGDLTARGSFPVGARPYPYSHNSTACGGDNTTSSCDAIVQPIEPGDYIADASTGINTNGSSGELFLVAAMNTVGSTTTLVLARGMNPPGCQTAARTHSSGWTPYVRAPGICGLGLYYAELNNPSNILPDNNNVLQGHSFQGGNINSGSIFSTACYQGGFINDLTDSSVPAVFGSYYGNCQYRSGAFPAIIGTPYTGGSIDLHPFNGSFAGTNQTNIQTHPGGPGLSYAPASEANWALDGRPFGGGGGGQFPLFGTIVTPVSGFTTVYKTSLPQYYLGPTSWDPKNRTRFSWAGNHLLHDVSGPGSLLSDSNPFQVCYVTVAGECVSGSSVGDMYATVPSLSASSLASSNSYASGQGTCSVNMDAYTICVTEGPNWVGSGIQYAVNKPDYYGRFRKLPAFLGGPGQTNNYWNVHGTNQGIWVWSAPNWANGVRGDIIGVKLPPWPNEDSVQRNTFIPVNLTLSGVTGSSVRARFGYDSTLFCGQRLEQCSTAYSTITLGTTGTSGTLITSYTPSSTRNNPGIYVYDGLSFTTSTYNTVTALKRWCVSGNSQTHTLSLSDGVSLLGSVSVNMAGCTGGTWVTGTLAQGIPIAPGTTYNLTSQEIDGGDYWYDYTGSFSVNSVFTKGYAVYGTSPITVANAVPSNIYVPVDLNYSSGSTSQVPSAQNPYSWLSEQQTWTACSSVCTVSIPAISSRTLYYVVDRKDASGNVTSNPMQVVPIK